MLVELLLGAVLLQQSSEHSYATNPQHLGRGTGLLGTSSLTSAGVSTLALGLVSGSHAGTRVDGDGLPDDEAILDKLSHVLACNNY